MTKPIALIVAPGAAPTLGACAADQVPTPTDRVGASARSLTSFVEPTLTGCVRAPATGDIPITITAGDVIITATLNDSPMSRDLIQFLPVALPWFRSFDIEYITDLPHPVADDGPLYTDAQPGDLVCYEPPDSITIVYQESRSDPTPKYVGEITSDLSVFFRLPYEVRVEIALER